MYPEDRVLVGVVNRKPDLDHVRYDHWYRIPYGQASHGIHAEYVAFFQSRVFGAQNGGIHFYARRTGHELVRRLDLLPEQPDHPRASDRYYKVQLGELREKLPPITNPTRRAVTFIYTTWDRFVAAETISELYSESDFFVDRVFYALRYCGIPSQRSWEAEGVTDDGGAQLCIQCEAGDLVVTTAESGNPERIQLQAQFSVAAIQQIIDEIRSRISANGGLLTLRTPVEE